MIMGPVSIRAADVKPGDLMNFMEGSQAYDEVIKVEKLSGDMVIIHLFASPHGYRYHDVRPADNDTQIWWPAK